NTAPVRLEALEREHHARELAARGDSQQWHRGMADIRRQMKLDRIDAERPERNSAMHEAGFVRAERAEPRLETRRAHPKRSQFGFHFTAELGGSAMSNRGQSICMP